MTEHCFASHRWRVCLAAVLLSLGLAATAPARAENIALNPNLNSALAPWTTLLSSAPDPVGSGTVSFDAGHDAGNSATSGSARIAVPAGPAANTTNAAASAHQCVAFAETVVSEANYGARLLIPAAGNSADGTIATAIEIRFYADAACTQFIIGGSQGRTIAVGVPDDAFWYSAGDPHFALPPGTLAQSAEIRASVRKASATGNAVLVHFDNLFLSLNGTAPIQLQNFGID